MKKYALKFEMPAWYVLSTELNNKFLDHCVQLLRCVFPKQEDYTVNTHFLNGESEESSFSEIYHDYREGLILKLLHRDDSCIHLEDDLILKGVREALIKFSECGTYFCIFIPKSLSNLCR